MCILIFSTTFVRNISNFKKNWERYDKKNSIGLSVEYPSFLSNCNEIWFFPTVFRKISKHQISWKSVLWKPSGSMRTDGRTDGRTDITKLIVAFRNFANASKKRQNKVKEVYNGWNYEIINFSRGTKLIFQEGNFYCWWFAEYYYTI